MPQWFVWLMDWSRKRYESLDKGYEESLRWVLAHRRRFITGILLLFAASLALLPKIGTEFLPVSDESQFRIALRGPVGQRVEKTEQQVAEIEKVLRAQIPAEELETIVSSTGVLAQGRSSLFNPNTGPHTSSISVYLVTPDKRKRNQVQIMNDVRAARSLPETAKRQATRYTFCYSRRGRGCNLLRACSSVDRASDF